MGTWAANVKPPGSRLAVPRVGALARVARINRLADNGIKFVGKRLLVKAMDAYTATTKAKKRN